jgi:hypothetical protein
VTAFICLLFQAVLQKKGLDSQDIQKWFCKTPTWLHGSL